MDPDQLETLVDAALQAQNNISSIKESVAKGERIIALTTSSGRAL